MPNPPIAKRIPETHTKHGYTRQDDYAWLRNRDNDPDVMTYLQAENDYTEAMTQHTKPLQETLYQEIINRIQLKDSSVPFLQRNYCYYFRTEEKQDYSIFCRHHKDHPEREEVLHDENLSAKKQSFYHVGDYDISFSDQKLAWTEDVEGDEYYQLYIKDLTTQEVKPELSQKIASDIQWSKDDSILFYLRFDATHRPYSVWKHKIGEPMENDICLYEENDERFWVGITRSKSDRFLIIHIGSKETTEERLLDLNNLDSPLFTVFPRKTKVRYDAQDHEDILYVLTNEDAINFRLMKTSLSLPNKNTWEEIIAHRENVKLESLELFKDFLVVTERGEAIQQLHVISLRDKQEWIIDFDEPCFDVSPTDNYEFDSSILRFVYTSLTTPPQIVDYNLHTKEKIVLKQTAVLGDFDRKNYSSERHFAIALDGTRIPISLVYKKDITLNANTPLYLYGYGAYGISLDPWFSHSRLSLLDRGVVFAIAHVRGGGDCGEVWHDQGKLRLKKNTFSDFISCAEYLISKKITNPKKLIISGGSAGGLLMGAVLNARPDLFAKAIADVPFVDCLNTMLDPTLPLTIAEYEEWGNPEEKHAYEDIAAYAPYEQVKEQDYPALLITAGLNDSRVAYWEPAKWCAKLRVMKTNNTPVLLKTELSAGHGGPSGRFAMYREVAFEYAFVLDL